MGDNATVDETSREEGREKEVVSKRHVIKEDVIKQSSISSEVHLLHMTPCNQTHWIITTLRHVSHSDFDTWMHFDLRHNSL